MLPSVWFICAKQKNPVKSDRSVACACVSSLLLCTIICSACTEWLNVLHEKNLEIQQLKEDLFMSRKQMALATASLYAESKRLETRERRDRIDEEIALQEAAYDWEQERSAQLQYLQLENGGP